MTRALAVALGIALFACLWLSNSLDSEREDHNVTRIDNARLQAAISEYRSAVQEMRDRIDSQARELAKRDNKIAEFNRAALDTAIAIQGATNDSPECNIDAELPVSLSRPLRVLHERTTGGDGSLPRAGEAPFTPVSAQTNAGTAKGNDRANARALDG